MKPHEEWLIKAEHDLISAKKLFEAGLYDTSMFHAHQCAEKCVKGFLTLKQLPLQKTHDLVLLNNLSKKLDNSFSEIDDACAFLNSRDVQFRYPSEEMEPTKDEIVKAIAFSEIVFRFVNSIILKN